MPPSTVLAFLSNTLLQSLASALTSSRTDPLRHHPPTESCRLSLGPNLGQVPGPSPLVRVSKLQVEFGILVQSVCVRDSRTNRTPLQPGQPSLLFGKRLKGRSRHFLNSSLCSAQPLPTLLFHPDIFLNRPFLAIRGLAPTERVPVLVFGSVPRVSIAVVLSLSLFEGLVIPRHW